MKVGDWKEGRDTRREVVKRDKTNKRRGHRGLKKDVYVNETDYF